MRMCIVGGRIVGGLHLVTETGAHFVDRSAFAAGQNESGNL